MGRPARTVAGICSEAMKDTGSITMSPPTRWLVLQLDTHVMDGPPVVHDGGCVTV